MNDETQLQRYKKLLSFIDVNFKEAINIEKIEAVSHYSYRNINRIFEALHQETIGKYIKRLRLEKAAQYLKYSEMSVSDIGFEVGFEDRAVFSKAFKKRYGSSPSAFRANNESLLEIVQHSLLQEEGTDRQKLQFDIDFLPDFDFLFLEYRGDYEDIAAIEKVIYQVYNYLKDKTILTDRSIFMAEIVDDSEISDRIHLRYNLGFLLDKPLPFEPEGLFRTKKHRRQKYAKFLHEGTHESCFKFYSKIYAFWLLDVGLELVDLPTLEFYPNYYEHAPSQNILTEIYIPVK
ncbi:MAG: AraC family transcriptional regulator [Cyanothece sp. SIO1E1]|nr:AraC family transcriptional regulator [Cyanothece sp. SIO1E1]